MQTQNQPCETELNKLSLQMQLRAEADSKISLTCI